MSPSTTTNMTSVLHRIGMWFSMALLFAIAVLNLTEFDSSIKIGTVKSGTWTPHASSISSFLSTDSYARDSSISSWSLPLRFLPQEPAVTTSSAPFFSRRKSTLLSKTPTGLSKHRLARNYAGALLRTTPICLPWSRPAQFLAGASIDFRTSLRSAPPAGSRIFHLNLSDSIKSHSAFLPFHTSSLLEHQVFSLSPLIPFPTFSLFLSWIKPSEQPPLATSFCSFCSRITMVVHINQVQHRRLRRYLQTDPLQNQAWMETKGDPANKDPNGNDVWVLEDLQAVFQAKYKTLRDAAEAAAITAAEARCSHCCSLRYSSCSCAVGATGPCQPFVPPSPKLTPKTASTRVSP